MKIFDYFINKQKSIWNKVFWYIKVYTFWKCIQNTMCWNKTKTLKKFYLRLLYEPKDNVSLSKTVFGIFHFRFRFVFIKIYIFVQQNTWTLWPWNVIIYFKIKSTDNPDPVSLPDLLFLSWNKKFQNSMLSAWVGPPQNWLRKSKSWERQFFSIVTFK